MDSWWQLGEGSGHSGDVLSVHLIACAFCEEEGNFKSVSHVVKKKPNSDKKLHFETLECGNCKGYVQVMWSAAEFGFGSGLHDFRVQPWSLKYKKYPDYWPANVGRFWLQAKRSMVSENWDAAAVMARSALQVALREQKGEGEVPPVFRLPTGRSHAARFCW